MSEPKKELRFSEQSWSHEEREVRSPAGGARQILEEPLTPNDAWDELVNKDDRTSPEEYPDMCLISFEELKDYMDRAVSAWLKPDFEEENRQLRAQVEGLKACAEAAAGLVEEIAASGTHTRWKRLADAIHSMQLSSTDGQANG